MNLMNVYFHTKTYFIFCYILDNFAARFSIQQEAFFKKLTDFHSYTAFSNAEIGIDFIAIHYISISLMSLGQNSDGICGLQIVGTSNMSMNIVKT